MQNIYKMIFNCNCGCKYATNRKSSWQSHIKSNKHIKNSLISKNSDDNAVIITNKFECLKCNYFTNSKSNYDRHIKSSKHNQITNLDYQQTEEKIETVNNAKYCEICSKTFARNENYFKHLNSKIHKKKCNNSNINDAANYNKKPEKPEKPEKLGKLIKGNTHGK